mmetsp:Transcript_91941/g.286598  ORF Transcript_91941/g.286598 Transcript_91941/m.286598 type:complete len:514 (+) Transcript_91941:97-1638(+)
MRGNRFRSVAVFGAMLLLLVGLYMTMEAWAMEKAQAEGQLAFARAESAKLVSSLDAKLRDAETTRERLRSQVSDLTAQLAGKDAELASASARAAAAQGEKAALGAQAGDVSRLRGLLQKAEAKAAAASSLSKASTAVEVEEVSWKDMDRVPVWVWWEFPKGVPTGYRLNVRTWMRHIPADKFELRLVNASNIKKYIPDLPDAFYRIYPLAQSDFVRAAMLALHGGVYMDGDMMLRDDLDVIFKELLEGTTEVTPYLWEHQECRKSFSTNFMAGTKGNALSRAWLEKVYKMMNARCPKKLNKNDDGMYEFYNHNGCCYNPAGDPREKCYVSFGMFGDRSAHAVMADLDKNPKQRRLRMTCISKWKGMAANASGSGGELLWKRLLPGPPEGYTGPIGPWSKVPKKEQRAEMCWRDGKADLRCTQSGLYPVFMERHGYHLFNLNNNELLGGFGTEEELLASGSVIAELYKLALEGEKPDPRMAQIQLQPLKVKEQDRAKNKWWGDTQQFKMPWLRG